MSKSTTPLSRGGRLLAASALLCCAPAMAHPGHPLLTDGFFAGLAHPWTGIDHLLAMTLVGVWAAQLGKRAMWALPACFLLMMAGGAVAASLGYAPPGVEAGIIASLVALGLLVAVSGRFAARWSVAGTGAAAMRAVMTPVAIVLVGLFAVFHGAAHGLEAPGRASIAGYAAGFLISTAALNVLGVLLGLATRGLMVDRAAAARTEPASHRARPVLAVIRPPGTRPSKRR